MSTQGITTPNTVVEVEFQVDNTDYPLAALSAETGGEAELEHILPRSEAAYTVFQRITGTSPDKVRDFVQPIEGYDATVISASGDELIVEFHVSGDTDFFTVTLTDAGAIPTQLASRDGTAYIVAEIPTCYSPSEVINQFATVYPEMEIIARRQKQYSVPLFNFQKMETVFEDLLTPRQHEVLATAYAHGYFDWPRENSAEDLADTLGISSPTFAEHLRLAQQKLLSLFFTK